MSETVRDFFIDSISGTTVQLRRVPGLEPSPAADAPMCPHQITVVTGKDSAVNASTEFYKTGCLKYRVTIARLS